MKCFLFGLQLDRNNTPSTSESTPFNLCITTLCILNIIGSIEPSTKSSSTSDENIGIQSGLIVVFKFT